MTETEYIKHLLSACTPAQRQEILSYLRTEFPIHPLETQLHTEAEVILEAIQRGGVLTLRMIRGVIDGAAFGVDVVKNLSEWVDRTPPGDLPYDFLLRDGAGAVRVQVKLQRSLAHQPMMASRAYRFLAADMYVVETQKTRGGSNRTTGGSTRPYRFGEFDLLAVSMPPSTNVWDRFMYTIADWLLPSRVNPSEILKFQPVATAPNDDWTDDFRRSVAWLRSGARKTIHFQ